ncbi:DUF4595 domain-containing protein [Bacteroides faecis]|nr:DUF4595 domain-containing protein [Bacteroides faecis]
MKYDADSHLIEMRRSEGGGEITNITYKDGDVIKTSTRYTTDSDINGDGVIDSNDEWKYQATIDYVTTGVTVPIKNKGCLMMFDELLDVDMDEMIYAYYGGMLGKATKHLPLAGHYTYDNSGNTTEQNFSWTLNDNGYPTELLIGSEEENERYTFAW